jgi:malonate transporter and related proteins
MGKGLMTADMTKILANALVPIFAGILLGYGAGLRRKMDNQNVQTLITFVMSFAVPAALFLAIASTPREVLRKEAASAAVLMLVYILLYLIGYLWSRSAERLSRSESSVVALTLSFPNVAAVGLPLFASVFGSQSMVAVAIALAIGSIAVSPITLAVLEGNRHDGGGEYAPVHIARSFIHSFKRPIVWAPLLGLAFCLAGWSLPALAARSLAVMGSAAGGTALVLTGLVVSAQKFEIAWDTLIAVILKNALQPALALGIAMLLHLPLEQIRYVVLISAMPCGFFGAVFGKVFDANSRLASSVLIASHVVSVGTLAAWIVIVQDLK